MFDSPRENEPLVTIAQYAFLPEAEVARMCLEEAGIPCALNDKEITSINWVIGNFAGGIRLDVRGRDAERAREVLATVVAPTTDEEAMGGDN